MKVVINNCYGGFGLSKVAKIELFERGCEHSRLMTRKEYHGGREPNALDKEVEANDLFGVVIYNDQVVIDDHDRDEARHCPNLVAVVEALGEEASGRFAELKIVEVPIENYQIGEYDGIEHVEEPHRTWS